MKLNLFDKLFLGASVITTTTTTIYIIKRTREYLIPQNIDFKEKKDFTEIFIPGCPLELNIKIAPNEVNIKENLGTKF